MVNSKSGGKSVSVSALSALRPPKPVTSSTLQQAKKSALASKAQMRVSRSPSGKCVVKISSSTPTGTARNLSSEELKALRETKRQVARHVHLELSSDKKAMKN